MHSLSSALPKCLSLISEAFGALKALSSNQQQSSLLSGEIRSWLNSVVSGAQGLAKYQSAQFNIPDIYHMISRQYQSFISCPDQILMQRRTAGQRTMFLESSCLLGSTKCDSKHEAKMEQRVSRLCGSEVFGGRKQQRHCDRN